MGDLVLGLLSTGGEGGLHEYPLLGEWVGLYVYLPPGKRVGCMITSRWGRGWVFGLLAAGEVGLMVTSCWGSWFQGYSPLGERVGFYDHFSLGMLGFMCTSEKKREKRKYLKKMKERAKEGKIKFIQLCFVYPFQG